MTQDVQGTATSAPTPRYAGTRVQRVGDNRLLTGRGSFVDDISRPGMLHAWRLDVTRRLDTVRRTVAD